MMQKLKDKWQQLAQRDRRIILFGGGFVVILLIYVYVWMPMSVAVRDEYAALNRGQRLVVWLQHASQNLQVYRGMGYEMPRDVHKSSLSVVNNVFKSQHIGYHVQSIKQLNVTDVGVAINQVPFDRLITALNILADQYGIVVSSTRMLRSGTDGLVNAKMILSRVDVKASNQAAT